jgi:hypothetical protein
MVKIAIAENEGQKAQHVYGWEEKSPDDLGIAH